MHILRQLNTRVDSLQESKSKYILLLQADMQHRRKQPSVVQVNKRDAIGQTVPMDHWVVGENLVINYVRRYKKYFLVNKL